MTYDLSDVPVLADPVERAANPEEPRLSHRVDAVGSTASHSWAGRQQHNWQQPATATATTTGKLRQC